MEEKVIIMLIFTGLLMKIFNKDYPDPDVIRVKDRYYMVTTSMHFMPGCEILTSKDLKNWEHETFVYDVLDETKAQQLEDGTQIYGKGMWAASLRYYKGTFYICFVANDTQKTYLYTASNIKGPWKKQMIQGFYHDVSLYFEEDRVFFIYGNTTIYITEMDLKEERPKENGLHRELICDKGNKILGYEGSHFYKIQGKYYLFVIHSDAKEWRRKQACFWSDSLTGTFAGKDIYDEDAGFFHQGIAQGGIVDTVEGDWYAMLFQDRGAVGRLPVLIPLHWEQEIPVLEMPCEIAKENDVAMDINFDALTNRKEVWQWNHQPNDRFWRIDAAKGGITFTSSNCCKNLFFAKNTLTQRTSYPSCEAMITVDASQIKEGDYAGISSFMGNYGMIGLTKEKNQYFIVMQTYDTSGMNLSESQYYQKTPIELERKVSNSSRVKFKVVFCFTGQNDWAEFYHFHGKDWEQIGNRHKLKFQLDHFCGCRIALFYYATKVCGGKATFYEFLRQDPISMS